MRHLPLVSAVVVALAACSSPPPPPAPPAAPPAPVAAAPTPAPDALTHTFASDINAVDFGAHLKKLSSDEFEGREPGTLGERLTTAYLKDQFERMGLKPGNKDSWFQAVPTVETTLTNTDVTLDIAVGGGVEKFAYKNDMIVGTLGAKPEAGVKDSDIVFVGYGVNAPEQNWNDYAGLDVKGKTVVVLVNDPGFANNDESLFKGRAMTYYGRWTYKLEEAARQGAAAAFIVHEKQGAGYDWDVVKNSWSGPQFDLPSSEDSAPRLPVAGWLTRDAAQRLFAKAGKNFDELRNGADTRGFKPVPLAAKLTVTLHSSIRSGSSDNVIALLPGSKRPDEVIVYSAHWDHIGKDKTREGDQIYNGAVDNGTGVAGLLEIAEAFAKQNPPPERSIVFAAVTLEESGLLGSKFYGTHPPYPAAKTVADINMDAMYLVGKANDMAVVGYGQSELDRYLADALTAQGRRVTPESSPEKGSFFRSDHFNFARRGIPALYAKPGTDLVDGGEAAGRAAVDDYVKNRYHQPSDEYRPDLKLDGAVLDLAALYAVGAKLANETTWPQWAADSEFRAEREKSQKK
jgi:Zn-dependent M28 family amino/carboxypeptidase